MQAFIPIPVSALLQPHRRRGVSSVGRGLTFFNAPHFMFPTTTSYSFPFVLRLPAFLLHSALILMRQTSCCPVSSFYFQDGCNCPDLNYGVFACLSGYRPLTTMRRRMKRKAFFLLYPKLFSKAHVFPPSLPVSAKLFSWLDIAYYTCAITSRFGSICP